MKVLNVKLEFDEAILNLSNDEDVIGMCLDKKTDDDKSKVIIKEGEYLKVYEDLFDEHKKESYLTTDDILYKEWFLVIK